MSVRATLTSGAAADIAEARRWYDAQQAGLGDAFLDAVANCLERIEQMPEIHPIVHQDIRRALLRRFPFGVFYVVRDGEAAVIAIMHCSRAPGRWQRRRR